MNNQLKRWLITLVSLVALFTYLPLGVSEASYNYYMTNTSPLHASIYYPYYNTWGLDNDRTASTVYPNMNLDNGMIHDSNGWGVGSTMWNVPISLPPSNAVIVSAKFNFYNSAYSNPIYAVPITSSWTGTTPFAGANGNLNYVDYSNATPLQSVTASGWASLDISSLFNYWKTHPYYGFALTQPSSVWNTGSYTWHNVSSYGYGTNGYTPYITVTYYIPVSVPYIISATNTSISIGWNTNGNPSNALYKLYRNGTLIYQGNSSNYQDTGLAAGAGYMYSVTVTEPDGTTSPQYSSTLYTIPNSPVVTGTSGGLGWLNSGGRGFVTLSWSPVPNATGYKIYVFDGVNYRVFDIGNKTSWDSRNAKIYPSDSTISSYTTHTRTTDIFNHALGGLDLRDDPNSLYKSAQQNGTYDAAHNYWFRAAAYNPSYESNWAGGNSDQYSPTLPNQTDSTPPIIQSFKIGNGQANVGSTDVVLNFQASDPLISDYTGGQSASGMAQVAVSNDNQTWQTFAYPADDQLNWTLEAGPGTKKVYLKVQDSAGNWSGASVTSVYNVNDVDPPVVSQVTIDNGAAQTTRNIVDLMVQASDNMTSPDQLKIRVSIDGKNWYYPDSTGALWTQSNTEWGPYLTALKNFNIGNTPGPIPLFVQIKDTNGNIGNGSTQITYVTSAISPAADSSTTTQTVNVTSGQMINLNGFTVSLNDVPTTVIQGNQVQIQLTGLTNVTGIRFSTNGVNWSPYEPLTSGQISYQKIFTFDTQGAKTVSIQLKNQYGVESTVITRNYLIDSTAPTVKASTTSNATATSASTMQISVQAIDNVTATNKLLYSLDQNTWNPIPANGLINVPVVRGLNSVTIYVADEAGNVGQSSSITIWGL